MSLNPRQAEPGQTFGYTTADGAQRELSADGKGVVRPETEQDAAVLDAFELEEMTEKPAAGAKPAEPDKPTDKPKDAPQPSDEKPAGEKEPDK